MTTVELENLRNRTWFYLTPEVASDAGMRLDQLQQFLVRAFQPSSQQLDQLALRLQLKAFP